MASERASDVLWFAAGLMLGAVVGLLAAPAAGADTRRFLADHSGPARDYVERGRELYEKGRQLADEAAHMYEEGRHLVEDQ